MKDERYKEIMQNVGMPHSVVLQQALKQVANEVAQEYEAKNQSDYSGVTEADFKSVDATFEGLLSATLPLTEGHPELEGVFVEFITTVGMQAKGILQKYANDNHVKHLEVEDYKDQLFAMKQKVVKIEMLISPVSNACNRLVNSIENTKGKR